MNSTRYLKNMEFLFADSKPEEIDAWFAQENLGPGIAIVGRSNVGKSSLINSLAFEKMAFTSKTPGRTQTINIFKAELTDTDSTPFYLYDLPGYGFASVSKEKSKEWNALIDLFFHYLDNDILLINIQDARHIMQKVDLEFLNYAKTASAILYLVLNKFDKLKTQKERNELQKQIKLIPPQYKIKQIFTVSAEQKTGLLPLYQSLESFILSF